MDHQHGTALRGIAKSSSTAIRTPLFYLQSSSWIRHGIRPYVQNIAVSTMQQYWVILKRSILIVNAIPDLRLIMGSRLEIKSVSRKPIAVTH